MSADESADSKRAGVGAGSASGPVSRWHYAGLGLPQRWADVRFRDVAVGIIVALTVWAYVDIGPRGRLVPGHLDRHRTDFTVFTEAGGAFFDGRNPYNVTSPRGWHYLYPPLFALLVSPLAQVGTASQVVCWFALNTLLAFACYGEARKLWRRLAGAECDPRLAQWVAGCAAAAILLPTLDCMQAGQLGIGIVYILLVGFRLACLGGSLPRVFAGGVLLALPAVIKLVPAFPVVFLLAQRWGAVVLPGRRRRPTGQAATLSAGVIAGAFLFLLAVPALFVGWQKNLDYMRIWQDRVVNNKNVGHSSNFNLHSYRNQSLANAIYLVTNYGRPIPTEGIPILERQDRTELLGPPEVKVALGVCVLALAGVGLTIGRRTQPLDVAAAYALACCATLVLSPLSWGHYYVVELPALLCVPLWLAHRNKPRLARACALVPPLFSAVYYILMKPVGSFGWLGLGTSAWFLFACGVIVWVEVGTMLRGRGQVQSIAPAPHFRVERESLVVEYRSDTSPKRKL